VTSIDMVRSLSPHKPQLPTGEPTDAWERGISPVNPNRTKPIRTNRSHKTSPVVPSMQPKRSLPDRGQTEQSRRTKCAAQPESEDLTGLETYITVSPCRNVVRSSVPAVRTTRGGDRPHAPERSRQGSQPAAQPGTPGP